MPVYQVSYDNINTERVKEALFSLLEREIKDDKDLTSTDPICYAQSSVWFIDTPHETVGTNLSFIKFNDKDILVTKIYSRNSVKANKQHVKDWLDYHLR